MFMEEEDIFDEHETALVSLSACGSERNGCTHSLSNSREEPIQNPRRKETIETRSSRAPSRSQKCEDNEVEENW
jgi:hypothetical protein